MNARERAEDLLVHYISRAWLAAGKGWAGDNDTEVRFIVDAILDACREGVPQPAELHRDVADTDSLAEHLEYRVAALEEIEAARWPRRILVRARLGRQLRASVRHFDGDTWADRRAAAASADWLARQ